MRSKTLTLACSTLNQPSKSDKMRPPCRLLKSPGLRYSVDIRCLGPSEFKYHHVGPSLAAFDAWPTGGRSDKSDFRASQHTSKNRRWTNLREYDNFTAVKVSAKLPLDKRSK